MLNKLITWTLQNWKIFLTILLIPIIVLCYQEAGKIPTWLKNEIVAAVRADLNIKYNEWSQKIEIQGGKIDSLGSSLATIKYIENPGFFKRLFSGDARDRKAFYDSVMSTIPLSVKQEFSRYGVTLAEVGKGTIVVGPLDIEVKVGNSSKFTRGELMYIVDSSNTPKYHLKLYKDEIEITDVRSKVYEDGRLYATLTAKSKLTGETLSTSYNRYIVDNSVSGWSFRPNTYFGVGKTWGWDGIPLVSYEIGADIIRYRWGATDGTRYSGWEWSILKGAINNDGYGLYTEIHYEF